MTVLSVWSDTAQLVLIAIGGALLLVAAILALVRMSRGPTTLDRAVASDVLIGIAMVGLAMEAVVNRHVMTVPIMLVLALVGFAGPVAIARFVVDPKRPSGNDGAAGQVEMTGDVEVANEAGTAKGADAADEAGTPGGAADGEERR